MNCDGIKSLYMRVVAIFHAMKRYMTEEQVMCLMKKEHECFVRAKHIITCHFVGNNNY